MSGNNQGQDSKKHHVRHNLKTGLRKLKEAIRPASHHPECLAASSAVASHTPSPAPLSDDQAFGAQHGQSGGARNKAWTGLETTLHALETSARLFSPLKSAIGELMACLDVIEAAATNRDDFEELASELRMTLDTLNQYAPEFEYETGSGSIENIIRSIHAQVTHISKQREHSTRRRLVEAIDDREDIIKCYRGIEVLFRRLQNEVALRTWQNTHKQRMASLLREMLPVEDARYDSKYSMVVKRRGCTPETREKVLEDLRKWVQDPTAARIYWMNGMAGTGKTTIAYSLCSWLEENVLLGASFFCSRISSSCRDLSRIVPTIAYQLAHYSAAYQSALCKILEADPDTSARNVSRQFDELLEEPLSKLDGALPEGVVIVIDALDEFQDQYGVRMILEGLLRLPASFPLKFFITSRPEPVISDRMLSPSGQLPSTLHLHDIEQSMVEEDIRKYLTEALGSMSPPPFPAQIKRLAKQAGKLFIYAATAARYILPFDVCVDSSARLHVVLDLKAEADSTGKYKKRYQELDILYEAILSAVLNGDTLDEDELEGTKNVLSMIICAKEPLDIVTVASLLELTEQQVLITLRPLQSVLHISERGKTISALHASFPDYMLDQSRSGQFYCNQKVQNGQIANRCFDAMERDLRFNICQLESSYVYDRNVSDLEERVNKFISTPLFYACRYWGQHLESGTGSDTVVLRDKLISFLAKRLLFWMEVMNLKGVISMGQGIMLCAQNWNSATGGPIKLQKQVTDARAFVVEFAGSTRTQSTPHIYISALPFQPKSSSVYTNYWGRMRGLIEVNGTLLKSRVLAPSVTWAIGAELRSISISTDGDRIVCGTDAPTFCVLSAHTGAVIAGPFEGHEASVESVAFSRDATLIASGSSDFTIRVWDALTCEMISGPIKAHTDSVVFVAFSHSAAHVISGSVDRTIGVWNTETGSIIIEPFEAHTNLITSTAISPSDNHIACASTDGSIRVWNLSIDNLSSHTLNDCMGVVYSVAFTRDGSRLASGSIDSVVRIWNPYNGELLAKMPNQYPGEIFSVAFSSDGSRVASGSHSGTIRVWDIDTKNVVAGPFRSAKVGPIGFTLFTPDDSHLICGYYLDDTICVWDACVSGPSYSPPETPNPGRLLASSPEGSRFVTNFDNALCVRDANNGEVVASTLQPYNSHVGPVAFSPDGGRVAVGCVDGYAHIFNATTGEIIIAPFEAHADCICALDFSSDGEHFATGSSDSTIKIWDSHTGRIATKPFWGHGDSILSVKFSADCALVATGSLDSTVRIWEASTGRCRNRVLEGHKSSVNSVAFSPDRTLVASGSDDTTIKLWKLNQDGYTSESLTGHTSEVKLVCFSVDGAQIISTALDGAVLVQDTHNGNILARPLLARPLEGRISITRNIIVRPHGFRIVTGTIDLSIDNHFFIRFSDLVTGHEMDNRIRGDWYFDVNSFLTIDNRLIAWVSPELRQYAPYHHETLVIGPHGNLRIRRENLALGERWVECYNSE